MLQITEFLQRQPGLLQNRTEQKAVHFFRVKRDNGESPVWVQKMPMPTFARAFLKTSSLEFPGDLSGTRRQRSSPQVPLRSRSRQHTRRDASLPSRPREAQIDLESFDVPPRDRSYRSEQFQRDQTKIPVHPRARGLSSLTHGLECRPTSVRRVPLEPYRATCLDQSDLEIAVRCTSAWNQCSTEVTL